MANSRCPTCDGPCWGPFFPDAERKPGGYAGAPVYAAYGGRRAFAAEVEGVADRFYNFGHGEPLYGWIVERDTYRDQPAPALPFFSQARLERLVPPAIAAGVLAALAALVSAVREAAFSGEPCPTCGAPTFVRDGARYALRGTFAVVAAARALYAAPSGEVRNGQPLPFFSETFLYESLDKDSGRSVLARPRMLLRVAGIEDVWSLEY